MPQQREMVGVRMLKLGYAYIDMCTRVTREDFLALLHCGMQWLATEVIEAHELGHLVGCNLPNSKTSRTGLYSLLNWGET